MLFMWFSSNELPIFISIPTSVNLSSLFTINCHYRDSGFVFGGLNPIGENLFSFFFSFFSFLSTLPPPDAAATVSLGEEAAPFAPFTGGFSIPLKLSQESTRPWRLSSQFFSNSCIIHQIFIFSSLNILVVLLYYVVKEWEGFKYYQNKKWGIFPNRAGGGQLHSLPTPFLQCKTKTS